MAEATLSSSSVWEGQTIAEIAGVTLRPSPIRHRLVFQASEHELGLRMRAAGMAPPPAILRAASMENIALLRPGPDEWLLVSEAKIPSKWREIAGAGAIEISHGYAGIEWLGPRVMLALSAGCPLDWHESAFPLGMATRTLYGKSEVLVWRQGPKRFHMEVSRSYLTAILGFFGETGRFLPSS
jgi:sarcosine oxidase, subunit gamma